MNRTTISIIDEIISNDSGLRLLRAKSAPLVLTFLFNTFHTETISSLPKDLFISKLEDFLKEHQDAEEVLESELEGEDSFLFQSIDLKDRVKRYISSWLSEEKRYIRRYRNSDKVEIIELDSGVSRLFSYISKILGSGQISTETNFNYVLFQLSNLAENLNEDPERRINELMLKRKEIDDEIERIKKTGEVKTYTERETVEMLKDIESRGKELIGDFSQVEDNFRSIIISTMDKQNEINISQNKVFLYALSLNSELMKTNQWQSFNAFWSYMIKSKDDRISYLAERIQSYLENEKGESGYDTSFLMSLRRLLFESGKKIVDRNSTLTTRMSRIMATSTREDRKGFDNLVSVIKQRAKYLRDDTKAQDQITLLIDENADLSFPMARTIKSNETESHIKEIEFGEEESNLDAILALKSEFYIDENELKAKIAKMFYKTGNVPFTLKELTEEFPIEKGLEEIIAYILLSEEKGTVDEDVIDEIIYSWESKEYKVRLPRIIFR